MTHLVEEDIIDKKEYYYIKKSSGTRSTGYNGYVIHRNYIELHIKTNRDGIFVVKCDRNTFNKLKLDYWCITLTGRKGYHTASVVCYRNKVKYTLKNELYPEYAGIRIEHLNNDPLDFRSNNIMVMNSKSNKLAPRKSKNNQFLPRGVYELHRSLKSGDKIVSGYCVGNQADINYRYFGVREFKTLDNALQAAIEYRSTLLKCG